MSKLWGCHVNYCSRIENAYLLLSRSHIAFAGHAVAVGGGLGLLVGCTDGISQLGCSMSFLSQ